MKFEISPQLILTKDEFKTLDNALKLCRDMDEMTGDTYSCSECPFYGECAGQGDDCVYRKASNELKKIIDVAVIK